MLLLMIFFCSYYTMYSWQGKGSLQFEIANSKQGSMINTEIHTCTFVCELFYRCNITVHPNTATHNIHMKDAIMISRPIELLLCTMCIIEW